MNKQKGPKFIRFFAPILKVLNELGGSGNSREVNDLVIEKMNISETELEEKLKSGASIIRDFRGAMQGRADKGIIITTGQFTQEAKKEAIRDGAPPIELVDGELLVDLFEKNELGVRPKIIYELDKEFFKEFMK